MHNERKSVITQRSILCRFIEDPFHQYINLPCSLKRLCICTLTLTGTAACSEFCYSDGDGSHNSNSATRRALPEQKSSFAILSNAPIRKDGGEIPSIAVSLCSC